MVLSVGLKFGMVIVFIVKTMETLKLIGGTTGVIMMFIFIFDSSKEMYFIVGILLAWGYIYSIKVKD